MSPAPIVLARVTSSVVSMVNEDRSSTSEGAIPASRSAAVTASAASWPSGRSMCLANSVCPMPTIAAASCSGLALPPMRLKLPPGGEDHRQGQRRAEGHPLNVRRLGRGVQREGPEAVEQGVDGDARLHPGEMHAEAHVDAEAEAHVLALLAEHVVAVGLRVLALVTVGRPDEQGEVGTLFDGDA